MEGEGVDRAVVWNGGGDRRSALVALPRIDVPLTAVIRTPDEYSEVDAQSMLLRARIRPRSQSGRMKDVQHTQCMSLNAGTNIIIVSGSDSAPQVLETRTV